MGIKKGDTVTWESQSAGAWTVKTGTVVHVVQPNERIENLRQRYRDVYNTGPIRLSRQSREKESYLVAVASPYYSKAKPKIYWPYADGLTLVDSND
jgi:hypothetical protein